MGKNSLQIGVSQLLGVVEGHTMTTTLKRWPIWTNGVTGSAMCQVAPPTWVFRLEDGSHSTVLPDGSEVHTVDRPKTPGGLDIALQ